MRKVDQDVVEIADWWERYEDNKITGLPEHLEDWSSFDYQDNLFEAVRARRKVEEREDDMTDAEMIEHLNETGKRLAHIMSGDRKALAAFCMDCGELGEDGDCDGEIENAAGNRMACPVASYRARERRAEAAEVLLLRVVKQGGLCDPGCCAEGCVCGDARAYVANKPYVHPAEAMARSILKYIQEETPSWADSDMHEDIMDIIRDHGLDLK